MQWPRMTPNSKYPKDHIIWKQSKNPFDGVGSMEKIDVQYEYFNGLQPGNIDGGQWKMGEPGSSCDETCKKYNIKFKQDILFPKL